MGTYAGLSLGRLEVACSKNENLLSFSDLYQEHDLKSKPINDSDDERPEEWYEQSLVLVKDRLELLGYTLEYAKQEFENPSPFTDDEPLQVSFEETMGILEKADVNRVDNEFSENPIPGIFSPDHIQKEIRSTRDLRFSFNHWDLDALLENFSPYSQLRVLAESPCNSDLPVIWDFDGVVRNGWVERDRVTHGTNRKFLIVTEGSSDSKILRKAFDLLKPHIKDYFYFVDMHEGYPFTGTGNLFNFVKGLRSINIKNDVVVVFDNDAEGVLALNRCKKLELPMNLKAVKLPDLEEFKNFPTIGPCSQELSDINGKAASIECYLDLEESAMVRWTNYRENIDCYHGSLIAKDNYKKIFLNQESKDHEYDYSKLERTLDTIISECVAIRSAENMSKM